MGDQQLQLKDIGPAGIDWIPVGGDREFKIVDEAIGNLLQEFQITWPLSDSGMVNPVTTWLKNHQNYSKDDFKGMVLKLLKERGVDLQNPDNQRTRREIMKAINDVLETDVPPKIEEVDAVPKPIRY